MNWLNFKWMAINIKWVINDAKKYNHRSLLWDKSVRPKFTMLKSQTLVSQSVT